MIWRVTDQNMADCPYLSFLSSELLTFLFFLSFLPQTQLITNLLESMLLSSFKSWNLHTQHTFHSFLIYIHIWHILCYFSNSIVVKVHKWLIM